MAKNTQTPKRMAAFLLSILIKGIKAQLLGFFVAFDLRGLFECTDHGGHFDLGAFYYLHTIKTQSINPVVVVVDVENRVITANTQDSAI